MMKLRILVYWFLAVMPCPLRAQLWENEYNVQRFIHFLSEHPEGRSVDDYLPLLKAELPENVRSRYLLMYHSKSLHHASLSYPRMILFSDDAKFILALQGDSTKAESDTFEIIQYNDEKEGFDFYHISFKEKKAEVEINPKLCNSCHGKNPRPNWEGYNLWPGAYGAMDDRLSANPKEADAFDQFIKTTGHEGRYTLLEGLPNEEKPKGISTRTEPYSHIYSDHWLRDQDIDSHYLGWPRANYKFGQEVGRLTVRAAAIRFLKMQNYHLLKGAVECAFDFSTCDKVTLDSLIPSELIKHADLDLTSYISKAYQKLFQHRLGVARAGLEFSAPPQIPFEVVQKHLLSGDMSYLQQVSGDYEYDALGFSRDDYQIAARLEYILDAMESDFNMHDVGTFRGYSGYSFTVGNSGIQWFQEALRFFSK